MTLKLDLFKCKQVKDEYFLENESLRDTVDSLTSRLSKTQEELRQLVAYDEETYQNNSNTLESYQAKFSQLEALNSTLKSEMNYQENQLKLLHNDIQDKKDKMSESKTRIQLLQEEKRNLVSDCKAKQEYILQLESLNDNLKKNLASYSCNSPVVHKINLN
jgi:chromosome segregation ATPase